MSGARRFPTVPHGYDPALVDRFVDYAKSMSEELSLTRDQLSAALCAIDELGRRLDEAERRLHETDLNDRADTHEVLIEVVRDDDAETGGEPTSETVVPSSRGTREELEALVANSVMRRRSTPLPRLGIEESDIWARHSSTRKESR